MRAAIVVSSVPNNTTQISNINKMVPSMKQSIIKHYKLDTDNTHNFIYNNKHIPVINNTNTISADLMIIHPLFAIIRY